MNKKLFLLFGILLLIGLVELGAILWRLDSEETAKISNSSAGSSQSAAAKFDKTAYSVNEFSSLWAVVNKGRALPSEYVPTLTVPDVPLRFSAKSDEMHLRSDAAAALEQLFTAAAKDKLFLRLASGYRSYGSQSAIYAREVRTYGQAQADRQSARPGHSEHQTGLAADLEPSDRRCEIADCFADTAEGKWLAAQAHKFGFVLRYPSGEESITGYRYEPWHFRFVGKGLAAEINKTGQTLERFFGLPFYSSYPAQNYNLM
ncbi:M15 family metallopeptidase [Candidatus Saccharibacteria bacterium]|nr:M15 family metallopeptidase [Candidatus Saccharibacteria bacterium]